MVRNVSEDKLYDTIEFNEFLQMMGKHQQEEINLDTLMDAFRWIGFIHLHVLYSERGKNLGHYLCFSTFDKDNDGFLTTEEFRKLMKGRVSKRDLELMVKEADSDNDGFINCKGKMMSLPTILHF